jgi:hypothetical protein
MNLLIIQSRIISVINEMHEERVLFSDEWKSETEGSSSLID